MKTTVTDAQLAAFAKRSHELYRRVVEGTLDAEQTLARLQYLIEGKSERPLTLAQMIAAAGFSPGQCDTDINERNFPLGYHGIFDASGLRLFGGNREWSIAEVEDAVRPEGGHLEGLVRGLAYIKENPDSLKGGPIIFPASSCLRAGDFMFIPFASLRGGVPRLLLYLGADGHRWGWQHRFLVSGK